MPRFRADEFRGKANPIAYANWFHKVMANFEEKLTVLST